MRIVFLLTVGLLTAFLAQPLPIQAEANPDQRQSTSDPQRKDKGGEETERSGGIPEDPKECVKDHGCMAHTVTTDPPVEKSIQGTTCNNGTMACNNPGVSCVIGGSKKCRTYDLNGSGNCTCACIP